MTPSKRLNPLVSFSTINSLRDNLKLFTNSQIIQTFIIECTKPGTNVTTILVESESHSVDFNILYLQCIPREFHSWVGGSELPFLPDFLTFNFPDIIFKVEDRLFKCHKVS